MTLMWGAFGPWVKAAVSLLPAAPDPVDWVIPWPSWVPFWPFGTVMASIVVVGVAALVVRGFRWIYGLIPFLQ